MKKLFFLFFTYVLFTGFNQAIGQDPYAMLKQTAAKNPVLTKDLGKVILTESDSRLSVSRQRPIAFRGFDMVDKTGKRIDPNEMIVVNGKSEKAQDIFNKLNEIEKEQNARGYSIRDDRPVIIDIVTPASSLDGKVQEMSTSVSPLKSEAELQTLSAITRQVGNLVLKPADQYSETERKRVMETQFLVNGSGGLSTSASTTPTSSKANRNANVAPGFKNLTNAPDTKPSNSTTALKVINETSSKDWSFGVMSTFQAGVKAALSRYSKICPFNPQSPGSSLSEFKVSANASVYAGLFDHSLDLLSGGVEFYAPSDSGKPMSVKVQIRAAGITIMSRNENFTQSKLIGESSSYSNFSGKLIDQHADITVPICCGISFSGKIGIKGNIGFNYGGSVFRTVVNLRAEPVIDLQGYAEAGVSLAGVGKLGAGGELTFIQGHIPFSSLVGIWAQNADQIVVGYNYYLGYDLTVLKGRVYGYADVCVPVIDKCHRLGEINFFKWNGFHSAGTIADGNTNYVINNL